MYECLFYTILSVNLTLKSNVKNENDFGGLKIGNVKNEGPVF